MRDTVITLKRAERELQAVIERLHYDFTAFDIQNFLQHLQQQRQRPIQVVDFPFTAEIYGLWVPAPTTDYIFVNAHLLPAHRVHTLLHEIAHLLLNHRGVDIRSILGEPVWLALGLSSGTGHLRSVALNDSPEDEEAEVFVLLIQQRVARARRLQELYGESTSLPAMRPYVHGLDLNS